MIKEMIGYDRQMRDETRDQRGEKRDLDRLGNIVPYFAQTLRQSSHAKKTHFLQNGKIISQMPQITE